MKYPDEWEYHIGYRDTLSIMLSTASIIKLDRIGVVGATLTLPIIDYYLVIRPGRVIDTMKSIVGDTDDKTS